MNNKNRMKKIIYILISLLAIGFIGCSDDNDSIPPSSLIKVMRINIYSNQSKELGETFFNRGDYKIWNNDSLPSGTIINNIKLDIAGARHTAILINGEDWNEVDSVKFAYPLYVTVVAENGIAQREYELKINIKK